MVEKIGDKKLRGVKPTTESERVNDPDSIQSVGAVKSTGRVSEAGGIGSASRRRPTREMSSEEREKLFQLINEEASKVLGHISPKKKELVAGAVKMAIDGGLLPREERAPEKKKG